MAGASRWSCVKAVLLTAILMLCSFGVCMGADADAADLVRKAQRVFDQGREQHQGGDVQGARVSFKRCFELLREAQQDNESALSMRLDRVFAMFFEELAAVDPDTAARFQLIRSQTTRTFEARPFREGLVEYHVEYLLEHKKGFLRNSFRRALCYIPMIQREFSSRGIPADLAYMALIESGFRPDPTSHAGASGLWQFMPATARRFGMRVDGEADERLDPVKSTRAACSYLKILHDRFGSWPLAVAAYNCGEGRVSRSMEKHGAETYWELVAKRGLPQETMRYVPSIIAVTLISRTPERYGLPGVQGAMVETD